jgi:autonomous glycyl radical cofactor GrcA
MYGISAAPERPTTVPALFTTTIRVCEVGYAVPFNSLKTLRSRKICPPSP